MAVRKNIVIFCTLGAIIGVIGYYAMAENSWVARSFHGKHFNVKSGDNDKFHADEQLSDGVSGGANPPAYIDRRTVDDIVAGRANIVQSYDDLVRLANSGDSNAAYQLYLDLYQCASLATRSEMLENIAASQDGKYLDKDVIDQITSSNIACKGVTDKMSSGMTDWLVLSARLGNLKAKVGFLNAVLSQYSDAGEMISKADEIQKFKIEGLKHLHDAASQGSAGALAELASAYREGVVTDRDYVKAYAYMMALERTGEVKLAGSTLATWEQDLGEDDLARARGLADRIYDSCCLLEQRG
jgi:hypothetical protein